MSSAAAAARGGRDDEFRTFVAMRRPQLVRTATLLTAGDEQLAEDLVQVSLTKLYLAWPRVRQESEPDGYAHRILVNAFTDERRSAVRRRERATDSLPDLAEPPTLAPEDRDAVRRALADLPPRMRAAVILRHWLEYDVAQAAAMLGCSQGTVKSQTARGLDRLRELLGPVAEPDPTTPARSTP